MLGVGVGLTANAQNFRSLNFLAPVSSITVSNTMSFTNLLSSGVTGVTTNINGLIYTNLLGNQVIVATNDQTQLATDIPLWSDRNGNPIFVQPGQTNGVVNGPVSGYSLAVHVKSAGTASTNLINITITPVVDGVNEDTTSADYWTVGVLPNGTTGVEIVTNVPIWKWPGVKALRLRSVTQTNVTASSQATIDNISLNGFVP